VSGAGDVRACSRTMTHTGTIMLTQDVVLCSEELRFTCFYMIGYSSRSKTVSPVVVVAVWHNWLIIRSVAEGVFICWRLRKQFRAISSC